MANINLSIAKQEKNDEFYTQYHDIEVEMNAYLDYDKDVFKGKTVLLPCDDPEWSNFTKYFAQKFETLGLKKLISTSFAVESKKYKGGYQPSLFEQNSPQYAPDKEMEISAVKRLRLSAMKQTSSLLTRPFLCSLLSFRGFWKPIRSLSLSAI